jgi:hypothetical protein
MEAKLYGQNKGGTSINGIIKDYYAYAGENISAGDLVEYVNGIAGKKDYGESVDTQLSTQTDSGQTISAVALDESRIFIAHSYPASKAGSGSYLYGMVCTINGATITKGTDTALSTVSQMGSNISTILLDDGSVFIAYGYKLYGMVVNIDGTTITAGTDTLIVDADLAGQTSLVKLNNGNIFIAHRYGSGTSNSYLYGMVVSISGSTITKGTDTALVSSAQSGNTISTCLLPNGNVFIAHSYGSSYHLYGMVVTIDGDTIKAGSDIALVSYTNTGYTISTELLPSGKVFIAHSYGSMGLYGMLVTIEGTTITKGTDTALISKSSMANAISTCLLPDGNVFIAHNKDASSNVSSYYLNGMIATINGDTITAGTDTSLYFNNTVYSHSGYTISALLLLNGIVFIAHSMSTNFYLYALMLGIDYEKKLPTNHIIATDYETQVRKVLTALFDGVAKTSGTGGDNTAHNEIVSIWTLSNILELLGIAPLRLANCAGKNLIDYTIYGANGLGDRTENLLDYTGAYARNTSQSVTVDEVNKEIIWTGDYFFYVPFSAPAGTTLVFDCESEYRYKWALYYTDGSNANNILNGEPITAAKEVKAIMVYKSSSSTKVENMVFKNLMLNYGEDIKPYEPYGYKIPIVSRNDTESVTNNIYIDAPLNDGENLNYMTDNLPDIPTFEGETIIDIDTTVKPNIKVKYEV